MAEAVGSGLGMQPGGGDSKLRKVFFISSNKSHVMWKWMWTRVDLNRKHHIEWNDSGSEFGIPDDAGSYALEDEFGINFRSFFVVCDIEDLTAAGFKSQAGNKNQFATCEGQNIEVLTCRSGSLDRREDFLEPSPQDPESIKSSVVTESILQCTAGTYSSFDNKTFTAASDFVRVNNPNYKDYG
eukprot:gene36232-47127_t